MDAVIDSSRYYVIRIKDPKSTRTTLLGIGFRERDEAFDFKTCLNDYVKFINRMDLASQLASTPVSDAQYSNNAGGSDSNSFLDMDGEENSNDASAQGGYKLSATSNNSQVNNCAFEWLLF